MKIITVTADTDLADLLDKAASSPVRLERNGIVYRLSREDEDVWPAPDPDRVREVLRATVGSWADLDADELIAELYRAREEGSRPVD